ncbi:hypothetical protein BLNAU_10119 [Blattamonas nauphoetae]|uniref:TmcB/TmcC TPR repeats domain-containing protein n=1 Tax=Blattamonas nauphoetae TaxID=2049346 RepID=A0ABQ9XU33_9EUKA|nr:hypothetical protein BLNAU_10119 [Blattamonas nauphoetae]
MYHQPRYPSSFLNSVVVSLFVLEFLATSVYGASFPNKMTIGWIVGFFDFSSFLSLFNNAVLVFVVVALSIILLQTTLMFLMAATIKTVHQRAPWISPLTVKWNRLFYTLLYIPILSILITPLDCHNSATRVNPAQPCWNPLHITLTILGCVFYLIHTLTGTLYSYYIFPHNQKQGGFDASLSGWPGAILSVFVSSQVLFTRVFSFSQGWRLICTIIPSFAMVLYYTLYQPYYRLLPNFVYCSMILAYFLIRTAVEITNIVTSPTAVLVTWVVILVVVIGAIISIYFLMRKLEKHFFILPKSGNIPIVMQLQTNPSSVPDELFNKQQRLIESRLSSEFRVERTMRIMNTHTPKDTDYVEYLTYLFNTSLIKFPKNPKLIHYFGLFTQQYRKQPKKAAKLRSLSTHYNPPYYIRFIHYADEHSQSLKINPGDSGFDMTDPTHSSKLVITSPANRALLQETLSAHRQTQNSTKEFWNTILQFNSKHAGLMHLLEQIVKARNKARNGYNELLKMHQHNPFLLRLYANLLRDLSDDQEMAEELTHLADQIEDVPDETDMNDGASRISMMKKKKKPSKMIDGIVPGMGGSSAQTKSNRSFIPCELLFHVLLLVMSSVGCIVIQNLLGTNQECIDNQHTIFEIGRRLNHITLYSKFYFVHVSPLYTAPTSSPYFPSKEECIGNLSALSTNIVSNLRDLLVQSSSRVWELQDTPLFLVSYSSNIISNEWFSTFTIFDTISHITYASLTASEETNTTSQPFLDRLAEPIINVPTGVMESLKRMLLLYVQEGHKNVILVVGAHLVNVVIVQLVCFVVILALAWRMAVKARRKKTQAFQLLLSIRKPEVYRNKLALMTSTNEMESIEQKWDSVNRQNEEWLNRNSTLQNLHGENGEEDDEEMEEEEEIVYAEEPVRVTVLNGCIETGGTFKLKDLLDPHPPPPRPPRILKEILPSIFVGESHTISKKLIKMNFRRKKKVVIKKEVQQNEDQIEAEGMQMKEGVATKRKARKRKRRRGDKSFSENLSSEFVSQDTTLAPTLPNSHSHIYMPSLQSMTTLPPSNSAAYYSTEAFSPHPPNSAIFPAVPSPFLTDSAAFLAQMQNHPLPIGLKQFSRHSSARFEPIENISLTRHSSDMHSDPASELASPNHNQTSLLYPDANPNESDPLGSGGHRTLRSRSLQGFASVTDLASLQQSFSPPPTLDARVFSKSQAVMPKVQVHGMHRMNPHAFNKFNSISDASGSYPMFASSGESSGPTTQRSVNKHQFSAEQDFPSSIISNPTVTATNHPLGNGNKDANEVINHDDDEEWQENEQRGIVRDAIADEAWQTQLGDSIVQMEENLAKLPNGVDATTVCLIIVIGLPILSSMVLSAVFLPLVVPAVHDAAASHLVWTNTMLQYYQCVLFVFQQMWNEGEITLKNTSPPDQSLFSSTILKDYSHLGTDPVALHTLISNSYDLFQSLYRRSLNGTNTLENEADSKLVMLVKRSQPEVDLATLMTKDGKNSFQCTLDTGDACPEDRIKQLDSVVDLNIVQSRMERLFERMKAMPAVGGAALDVDWEFLLSVSIFDMDYFMRLHETGFLDSFAVRMERVNTVVMVVMSVQLVCVACSFFAGVVPLLFATRRANKISSLIISFLPSDAADDDFVMNEEMLTNVAQLDAEREALLDEMKMIVEGVRRFSPLSELQSMLAEFAVNTRTVFKHEEATMVEQNYESALLEEHKLEHLRIRQRITMLTDSLLDKDRNVAFASLALFVSLLEKHFQDSDGDVGLFVAEQKVSLDINPFESEDLLAIEETHS